jgi:cell division septation protein DedD
MWVRARWLTAAAVSLAVLALVSTLGAVPAAGATATAAPGPHVAGGQGVDIDVTVQWSANRPDRVRYTYTFDAPSTAAFALVIDEHVDAITGFERAGDGRWVYDGTATEHSVTVTQSVETATSENDWVYSADSGVLVSPPRLSVVQETGGDVRETNPLGRAYENVAVDFGDRSGFRAWERIYVGSYTTYTAEHGGETVTIYRPALAADGRYEAAVRSVLATADHVPMSDPPATAEFVVFPDAEASADAVHTYRGSRYAGYAEGTAEDSSIVDAGRPVDDYGNTWAHEYVHFEQEYRGGTETRWLHEAQAEYLTARSMHAAGCGHGDLRGWLSATGRTSGDVLSDPSTWDGPTQYQKGSAVVAAFDTRLHTRTGGRVTMRDVFAAMEDDAVRTHAAFLKRVNRTVGDPALNEGNARYLARYVTTADFPGEDAIDHPPMERAPSCLADYQHVTVETTSHGGGTTEPSPPAPMSTLSTTSPPTASVTAPPAPAATTTPAPMATAPPTATTTRAPAPASTATPPPAPGADTSDGSRNWLLDLLENVSTLGPISFW